MPYFIKVSFCKLDLRMDENDLFKLLSFGFGGDLIPVIEFSFKISLRNQQQICDFTNLVCYLLLFVGILGCYAVAVADYT